MDGDLKNILEKTSNTIRGLSIDAIQKANSGHPGLPLGCAEIGAYLYGVALNHYPKEPTWINRDRFILSAGHGSMLLYSCLHLSGFDLSLDDIKNFRKLHSKTPGHPEYHISCGIETTTGPLGQGIGNAVGLALSYKILQAKFNTDEFEIFNNKIFCLAGDGDIMEGCASEASSLAGHLDLNNLILIYDANKICLDGPISETLSEDTKKRYEAYNWDVIEIDPYDFTSMHETISSLKESQMRPTLIIANTLIGKGSPHKAGSHKVHGSPLGVDELKQTKKALNLPDEDFYVPQQVIDFFSQKMSKQKQNYLSWEDNFRKWSNSNPSLLKKFQAMKEQKIDGLEEELKKLPIEEPIAGRKASNYVLNQLSSHLSFLIGGSADLSCSDLTTIKDGGVLSSKNYLGKNIKYGVREFSMGTIANGLFLSGMFRPFIGTFLVFSDYLKNAIRLAALSKYKVIYQFTHDSIFLGEDGPTHQPVEHLAGLRAMPDLNVIRPASSYEVKMAWIAALSYDGPTAIVLSRQALVELDKTHIPYEDGMQKGAYIVKKEKNKPDYTLFATGSELKIAFEVAERLEKLSKDIRIVSIPCFELFDEQPKDYRESIIGGDIGKRVSIEAGSDFGWYKYIGKDGIAICVDTFGASAPPSDLAIEYGFTPDAIVQEII